MKRVAGEIGHAPTRREYETRGGLFSKYWLDLYGWNAVLIQAGYEARAGRDPKEKLDPAVARFEKQVKKFQGVEVLTKNFEEQITPFIGKYEKVVKGRLMTVMTCSDLHSQWLDQFAWSVFVDSARRIQPDVIVFAGDIFDFYQISSFSKNPRRAMTMQSELDYIIEKVFKVIREACPDAQIDFFIGNHEWRLFKYLCEDAPALASLRVLSFDSIFELEKYRINLVARPSFLNAKKEKDLENYKVYGGCYVVTHGISCAKQHATNELDKYNMSGASGHVHHYQTNSQRDLYGNKVWTSMGCMCVLKSGEEYIADLVRWNQGFNITHIDIPNREAVSEYVHLGDHFAIVGGKYYFRNKAA